MIAVVMRPIMRERPSEVNNEDHESGATGLTADRIGIEYARAEPFPVSIIGGAREFRERSRLRKASGFLCLKPPSCLRLRGMAFAQRHAWRDCGSPVLIRVGCPERKEY